MAFTSGTAADYLDLLNRLKQFVTQDMLPANERWSVLRWVPGPPAELVLQGPGLAGTDQINVGILSEAGADYGNWKLRETAPKYLSLRSTFSSWVWESCCLTSARTVTTLPSRETWMSSLLTPGTSACTV